MTRHRRPETASGPVRDRHHRALQAQGIVRGGVSHRDVPGGRIRAPRGRRDRTLVGIAGKRVDRQQPEPEGVREDRGMADRAKVASANSFVDMTEPSA